MTIRNLFGLFLVLTTLSAPAAFGAASDEAWVEGTVTKIMHDIVYVRAGNGELWKLKRAWVEKTRRNFRPGDTLKIQVDFNEAMRFQSL